MLHWFVCFLHLLVFTSFFSSNRAMVTGKVALELPVPNAVVKAFAMFQMNLKNVPNEPDNNVPDEPEKMDQMNLTTKDNENAKMDLSSESEMGKKDVSLITQQLQ